MAQTDSSRQLGGSRDAAVRRIVRSIRRVRACLIINWKTAQTYSHLMPLGNLIYEAFPELGIIAAGLCIKTGNDLILKGSGETSHSNAVSTQVLSPLAGRQGTIGLLGTAIGGARCTLSFEIW